MRIKKAPTALSFVPCTYFALSVLVPPAWGATPVGYWNLDEGAGTTAADSSGLGNTGTLVNSPTWVSGHSGNALDFANNGHSYVTVAPATSLANLYANGMTVAAWINPRSAGGGSLGRIVDKDNNDAGWFLAMNGTTAVRFAVDDYLTSEPSRVSTAVLKLNQWQHVAATWDGSAQGANIHIYINGVLADGSAVNGSGGLDNDSGTPLAIGNRAVDLARGFDGTIDEVRVYNGVLSAAEIAALVTGTSPPPDTQAPTVPTGLATSNVTATSLTLSWSASTDLPNPGGSGIGGYYVYRNGTTSPIATVTSGTSFADSGLASSTTYTYQVAAFDKASPANVSAPSTALSVTTQSSTSPDTQAPTVPTGLATSNVTATSLTLSWSASTDLPNPGGSGIGGYYVYRNGTTSPIATVTSGTSFADSGLASSTTYTYQVAAFDKASPANVSAPSSVLSVTTQSSAPPSGWTSADIGSVGATGSSSISGGTFTVTGSGTDIWGSADSFRFVWQSITGDATISARVVSQTQTSSWAKAGVMFRETSAAGSKFAAMLLTPANGAEAEARTTTGASAVGKTGFPVKAPYWVRLVRSGNQLGAYVSADGNSWSVATSYTVSMAATVSVGLAVTSHSKGVLSTAVFDNVTITTAQSTTSQPVMVAPTIATLTTGSSQQFTATVSDGSPVTWAVDGITGGNGTVGSISQSGLYTTGTAVGTHTIVATSVTDTTKSATAIAAVTDLAGVFTYHNNLSRDGTNTQEYALSPSNANIGHFGKLTSCTVDGTIASQPLWAANLVVQGVQRDVVFVTTQHDGLFAFDADAIPCLKLWSANLIDANHGGTTGETPVPSSLVGVGDGDVQPEIGVYGTPVIDPTAGVLYVVSKSVDPAHNFYQRLHAIDLLTGTEKPGSPVLITGSYPGTGSGGTTVNFDPQHQNQHASLALVNGVVYIAWGSHEDSSPWYGWMIAYRYDGTSFTQNSIINVAPNTRQAGIWMGGGAPAADSSGKLYVITGNGNFDATGTTGPHNDYGDSLLQLTPSLTVSQWFTPSDQLTDSQNDLDFGSGGTALLADLPAGNTITHALICGGKDHAVFVLNRDLLGGFGDTVAVQKFDFGAPIFGTGSFWNNNLFLAGVNGPLRAYKLNTSTAHFSSSSSSTHSYGFPGSTPSVSSAGTQNGIVWTLDNGLYCTQQSKGCGPAVLYAHDANNVATELWDSNQDPGDVAGNAVKFSVPTVANGKVYVGTRGNNTGGAVSSTSIPGELEIYGLKR